MGWVNFWMSPWVICPAFEDSDEAGDCDGELIEKVTAVLSSGFMGTEFGGSISLKVVDLLAIALNIK